MDKEFVIIKFDCFKCKEHLIAGFSTDDDVDRVHCDCGKIWLIVKPISITKD